MVLTKELVHICIIVINENQKNRKKMVAVPSTISRKIRISRCSEIKRCLEGRLRKVVNPLR